ncbi:MAG: hypothetical protein ACYTFD_19965 [Planctomycetota bacterium]|jgi:hypothetical protein
MTWFGFDDLFWLTVLVIFVATLVAALLARLRKDKCLKLLDEHHVTYLTGAGAPLWGDLQVASQGLELVYDAPYTTSRGLAKTSYLVYADEWAECVAVCRSVHGLSDDERAGREEQIRKRFAPGVLRRLRRSVRNLFNTIRDGVSKTLMLFVGALASRGAAGQAVAARKGEVDEVGRTLVGAVANAYEPLLERHIGKPVILELRGPSGLTEFPGFLVDYSERFVAVFNVEQPAQETLDFEAESSVTRQGLQVKLEEGRVLLTCAGPDAHVVRRLSQGERSLDLGVTLLPGCTLGLPRTPGEPVRIEAERTQRLDLVCPRGRARVRFGSERAERPRSDWSGVAPEAKSG